MPDPLARMGQACQRMNAIAGTIFGICIREHIEKSNQLMLRNSHFRKRLLGARIMYNICFCHQAPVPGYLKHVPTNAKHNQLANMCNKLLPRFQVDILKNYPAKNLPKAYIIAPGTKVATQWKRRSKFQLIRNQEEKGEKIPPK